MKYFAVCGRMCGDDEDTALVIEARSRTQAVARFKAELWSWTGMKGKELKEAKEDAASNGKGVFVNHVLVSDTPIKPV